MHLAFLGVAQIFGGLQPHRHARAIVQLHVGDGVAEHLDLARLGVQVIVFGIGIEIAMAHPGPRLFRGRLQGIALVPEVFKAGGFGRAGHGIGLLHDVDVFRVGLIFDELRLLVEQVGNTGKNVEIAAAFADWFDHLLHRVDAIVGIGAADRHVIALQRR